MSTESPTEHVCAEDDLCSCEVTMVEPDRYCPQHGGERRWPPRCVVCGRFVEVGCYD